MGDETSGRKKPADFWGIPGSGLIAQSAGTAADVGDYLWGGYKALTKPQPEASMFPALDLRPGEVPEMPPGSPSFGALQREQEMLDAAAAAKNGGALSKALHWGAPMLSLGAGAMGLYQGVSGLLSGEGRTIDNVGNIVSGVADSAAGATGLAYAGAATEGTLGALASASRFAGPLAAAVGFGVYGERESADVMQMDFWGEGINNAFKDDEGNKQSMYEAAWDVGGDMVDGAHDYMADTWLGEDVGGFVGTVGGGLGAGATLAGATAANIGIGAVTAACDLGEGAYSLGKGALGLGGQGIDAVSDWWNSDW
jgi:hypothetical protein